MSTEVSKLYAQIPVFLAGNNEFNRLLKLFHQKDIQNYEKKTSKQRLPVITSKLKNKVSKAKKKSA